MRRPVQVWCFLFYCLKWGCCIISNLQTRVLIIWMRGVEGMNSSLVWILDSPYQTEIQPHSYTSVTDTGGKVVKCLAQRRHGRKTVWVGNPLYHFRLLPPAIIWLRSICYFLEDALHLTTEPFLFCCDRDSTLESSVMTDYPRLQMILSHWAQMCVVHCAGSKSSVNTCCLVQNERRVRCLPACHFFIMNENTMMLTWQSRVLFWSHTTGSDLLRCINRHK